MVVVMLVRRINAPFRQNVALLDVEQAGMLYRARGRNVVTHTHIHIYEEE